MRQLALFLVLSVVSLHATDVLTVDATNTVIINGSSPAAAPAGEVILGNGQVNANGTVTAGDVVINRTTQATTTEAVRGDDPRLTNARPASGGDAATVGGNAPSAFVATANKGVANGVASLDATGKVPAAQIPSLGSSAKAWVSFNGSGGATINASAPNISQVVRNAAGDYTIFFSPAMTDAHYVVSGSTMYAASGNGSTILTVANQPPTISSVRVWTNGYNGIPADSVGVYVAWSWDVPKSWMKSGHSSIYTKGLWHKWFATPLLTSTFHVKFSI
jgi:hypothetical protein